MYSIEGQSQPGCGCSLMFMLLLGITWSSLAIFEGQIWIIPTAGFFLWLFIDGPAWYRVIFKKEQENED